MKIAVVGDVHGHLALMYAILGRWQSESNQKIDLILQLGDLGAFPLAERLDSATRRWAENDPEELGFAEFAGPRPPKSLMDPRPLMVFIPGNHEDFDFLQERERASDENDAIYPASEDGRICALRSGRVWTFTSNGERVRIAGVAGVANRSHKKSRHPRYHLNDDDALELATRGPGEIDILISHDGPQGPIKEDHRGMGGSPALRLVIEEAHPRLAFFGHYDQVGKWRIGLTDVYGMGKCGYVTMGRWPIARAGVAIVSWLEDEPAVERLETGWLDNSTRYDWRHWKLNPARGA
jgi:hypothetical protein